MDSTELANETSAIKAAAEAIAPLGLEARKRVIFYLWDALELEAEQEDAVTAEVVPEEIAPPKKTRPKALPAPKVEPVARFKAKGDNRTAYKPSSPSILHAANAVTRKGGMTAREYAVLSGSSVSGARQKLAGAVHFGYLDQSEKNPEGEIVYRPTGKAIPAAA